MKKRDRVLGALSAVVFGVLLVTIVVAFVFYFIRKDAKFPLDPEGGFKNLIAAFKNIKILFDFEQTEVYVITQFLALGFFALGAVWGLVWLIIGAFKKHLIEILFFLGICVAFFFFGFMTLYQGEFIFRYFAETAQFKANEVVSKLLFPGACLLILAGLIVTFAYDMKRIFASDQPLIIVEPEEYSSETLFDEVFYDQPERVAARKADDDKVKSIMEKVDNMILEENVRAAMPLEEEDIPSILREPEVEEEVVLEEPVYEHLPVLDREDEPVYEHLPILDKVEEEVTLEEPVYEHLPILDKVEEEVALEEPVYEHLPILDKVEEKPVEKVVVYEHLPILDRVDEEPVEKEPSVADLPDCMKTESELAKEGKSSKEELPPFMREGYVEPGVQEVVEVAPAPVVPVAPQKPVHHSGKAFHISSAGENFQVKVAGSKEVLGLFATEEDAVGYIRSVAPEAPIRVHDKNGKIRSI